LLSRIHGGAVISSGVENVGYEAPRFISQEEKRAIGAGNYIAKGFALGRV
jgi:DeoR family glycerol-3-phosphate regulon repressor